MHQQQAKLSIITLFILGTLASSTFAVSCIDDSRGGQTVNGCAGCITYMLATSNYRACSSTVPCTDQATFNQLANRCAQQYQQCRIQCCTTELCNSATGSQPVVQPQPIVQPQPYVQPQQPYVQPYPAYNPGIAPQGNVFLVSGASSQHLITIGTVFATALSFAARF